MAVQPAAMAKIVPLIVAVGPRPASATFTRPTARPSGQHASRATRPTSMCTFSGAASIRDSPYRARGWPGCAVADPAHTVGS
jgi:hypothetical protein